ncbi:hypothetical protein FXO38_35931 [Capsicum annuum]|nr:hypothetical protein FXO38_35931 [Capsicum annuum]
MIESTKKFHASVILPYGLLITRILMFYSIDIYAYPSIEVTATYNSRTFSSMGYVLVEYEWCQKEFAHAMAELPKVSKSASNLSTSLLKELEELNKWFKAIEESVMQHQESTTKLLDLGKSISSNISIVWLTLDGLKSEGFKLFSQVLSRMDSFKSQVSSSNDDLAISVQPSYSSLSKI